MRIMITCVGGYGNLHPLLPLAQALKQAGHDVAIVTGPDLFSRARNTALTAWQAGLRIEEAFERLAERHPDGEYNRLAPSEILAWYLPHLFGEVLAPAMLDDLEPLADSWQPDLIVHDTHEFAGPIVAAKRGIPSISHTLGPRFPDRVVRAVAAAVAPQWRQHGLHPDPSAGLYRYRCLDITPPGLQPSQEQVAPRDVVFPLRPVAPPLPGEALPQWVERRCEVPGMPEVPLVYMTLGTVTNSDLSMFQSVIDGLGGLDMDVLITIGFGRDPASIGLCAENVHVESYVPQSLLLPHCSAVICHGGAGTTLNSLALGLPLLVFPQGADQYVIGSLVAASGAGLLLTPQQVNPSAVRSSVLALLHEPSYGAGARLLQHEIDAMSGPEEAFHLIEEVAAAGVPHSPELL